MTEKINQYQVEAREPEYTIIHVWQGFELQKAKNIALDLKSKKWRDIKVVPLEE